MSGDAVTPLFPGLDAWDPAPLREKLRRGGFHKEALESLGLPERWLRSIAPRAAMLGRVPEGSALETLLRLFTLGDEVEGGPVLAALGDAANGLLDLGFLVAGGGRVRSLYQIVPLADRWMACDFPRRQGGGCGDFVMGIGPSSVLLGSLTPHVGGRALELASGIGWLAGNLAQAGMEVVATDVSARALALGRFSARLCGIGGVDFRCGDGFSTVAGETFDLIVANPPYVQSPGGDMTFREGPEGDPVCARLLRGIPAHLAPGGIAVVLLNWMHADDDDWEETPLSWVPAEGTRRWLFQSDCSSPAEYAWTWISGDLRYQDELAAEAEMRRWLAFYRNNGVRRVSGGFMVIQKCDPGGEWTRTDSRSATGIDIRAGSELLRIVENETWLAGARDLLETRFRVPDGARAEVVMDLEDGWARRTIRLTSPARLSYDGQIDENILRLLELCRAGRPPADMLREIQAKPEFAAIADLPERIAGLVRELVSHGMLVPADGTAR